MCEVIRGALGDFDGSFYWRCLFFVVLCNTNMIEPKCKLYFPHSSTQKASGNGGVCKAFLPLGKNAIVSTTTEKNWCFCFPFLWSSYLGVGVGG